MSLAKAIDLARGGMPSLEELLSNKDVNILLASIQLREIAAYLFEGAANYTPERVTQLIRKWEIRGMQFDLPRHLTLDRELEDQRAWYQFKDASHGKASEDHVD